MVGGATKVVGGATKVVGGATTKGGSTTGGTTVVPLFNLACRPYNKVWTRWCHQILVWSVEQTKTNSYDTNTIGRNLSNCL